MTNMNSKDKAELMKSSIFHLYSKEGRSISYISRLLGINRKTVSDKIKEWNLPEAEPRRHLSPSKRKFLNKNRNLIKSRLDNDVTVTDIAKELKISRDSLYKTYILNDEVLKKAHADYANRIHEKHTNNIQSKKDKSKLKYDFENLPGEEWKQILGYPDYYVSNKGRVKHYIKQYDSYILLKQQPNKNNGRLYVRIPTSDKKSKNLQVANLVGHAFVDGYDEKHHTINHEDGNVQNNWSDNLTWQTQSENNTHAYRKLNRSVVDHKRYKFKYILYQNKYQFKTVAAFAKFIGKSETQTRRYLDEPQKHNIQLINNCND